MEVRKLQKTGGSTYLISLPKEWVERMGLKQGDPIAIFVTKDGSLLLDPRHEREAERSVATINIDAKDLFREIVAKYLLGYDIIQLVAKDRITYEQRMKVKATVQKLVGVEIVDEDSKKITLQCLLSPVALPVKKSLKRIYMMASRMHMDAVDAFLNQDEELAKNVINRDDEVDRLYFLLVRQLRVAVMDPHVARKLNLSPLECLDYRLAVKIIESLADCAVEICERAIEAPAMLSTDIRDKIRMLSNSAYEMHKTAFDAFYNRDKQLADTIIEKKQKFYRLLEDASATALKNGRDIVVINSVINTLKKMGDYGEDLADLVVL
ncbi:MAG: PhoU domain-containing protein [Candidatus Baldrarchaeia archaeon]